MRLQTIFVLFLLGISVACGQQRFPSNRPPAVRTRLQGNELLVVLEDRTRGGGSKPQGIYAVDSDGNVRLVVARAKSPRWSPDRRSIVFMGSETASSDLFRIDIEANSCHQVRNSNYYWRDSLLVPGRGTVRPHSLAWFPSGDSVVAWSIYLVKVGQTFQGPFEVPVSGRRAEWEGMTIMGQVLIPPKALGERDGYIGLVSFGPSSVIAYERHSEPRWSGIQKSEVWVYDPDPFGEMLASEIRVPLPDCVGAMNPLWSPDKKWLAVDAILDSGRDRQCVVLSADMQTFRRLPQPVDSGGMGTVVEDEQSRGWGGVAWNPDSVRLLTAKLGTGSGLVEGGLAVVEIGGNGRRISPDPILQAVWSPDGNQVAYIQHFTLVSALGPGDRSRWVSMSVVEIDGIEARSARPVFFPEGMIPVSIDW